MCRNKVLQKKTYKYKESICGGHQNIQNSFLTTKESAHQIFCKKHCLITIYIAETHRSPKRQEHMHGFGNVYVLSSRSSRQHTFIFVKWRLLIYIILKLSHGLKRPLSNGSYYYLDEIEAQ